MGDILDTVKTEIEKLNRISSGNIEGNKSDADIPTSDAVPDEPKNNEEVHDPEKHIHASFIILSTTDMSKIINNPRIILTELEKTNIGT